MANTYKNINGVPRTRKKNRYLYLYVIKAMFYLIIYIEHSVGYSTPSLVSFHSNSL